MPVNSTETLDALIVLAKAIRAEGGHGRWDGPGIKAAIAKVKDRSLADVMLAVARAADDPTLVTPGAIGNPTTSCWEERKVDRRTLPDGLHIAALCSSCVRPASDSIHDPTAKRPDHHLFIRQAKEPTRPENTRRKAREDAGA